MCFVWIWKQTAIISLCWLVFITETECVYCAVGTGSLNTCWRSHLTVLPVLTNRAPSDQCANLYNFSLKGFCMLNAMSNTRNFTVCVLKCWLADMWNIFLDISPIYLRTKLTLMAPILHLLSHQTKIQQLLYCLQLRYICRTKTCILCSAQLSCIILG